MDIDELKSLATALEKAMSSEGVSSRVIERVIHRLLYGCVPEDIEIVTPVANPDRVQVHVLPSVNSWTYDWDIKKENLE